MMLLLKLVKYPSLTVRSQAISIFELVLILMFGCCALLAFPLPVFGQADIPKPEQLILADGFRAELVFAVPAEFGSWVSLTDVPGGLVASDQYGKLYRIRPGQDSAATQVEPIDVKLGRAQGLLWAFDSLYVVAHEGDGQPAGLYRVTDSDHDGKLDNVQLLRRLRGGGEHGPHAVILSPDQKSLFICAGNHTELPDYQSSLVPEVWKEDQLLRRMWDPGGHAVGINAPGGWICKTDPQGKSLELFSVGFRNQYDIAFNAQGELFTYDADMEWDIGTTWYRPTRVCHVTAGSEFGWRGGNGKWPEYYPDSLPAIIDIGPGSPTGIVFGTRAKFADKYRRALFIADWSFGFIYAVHLTPAGGSYRAEKELFCSAPALQVTDMAVGEDGGLYFAIGGRRTQSALYRITANDASSQAKEQLAVRPLTTEQQLRRQFEQLNPQPPVSPNLAMAHLDHPDRFVRFAARTWLERSDDTSWQADALNQKGQALLESTLALLRSSQQTSPTQQLKIVDALTSQLQWDQLSEYQQLHVVRNLGLALMRAGNSNDPDKRLIDKINQAFSSRYPGESDLVNRELARLLIKTNAPNVIEQTLGLINTASTQEQQIHYAMCLRVAKDGWTQQLRQQYLEWFSNSLVFQGGKSFSGYLINARDEFIREMPAKDKAALESLIQVRMENKNPYAEIKARPFVKDWTVDELLPVVERGIRQPRDLENGKKVFTVAQCFKCHRFDGDGGIVGPDLTGLSRRYSTRYLLESFIEPSKEISDLYHATKFVMDDGRMIVGRVANLNGNNYLVQEDMIAPGKLTSIDRRKIDEMMPSEISPMPEDLLDHLNEDEILDLLAYLRSVDTSATPSGSNAEN